MKLNTHNTLFSNHFFSFFFAFEQQKPNFQKTQPTILHKKILSQKSFFFFQIPKSRNENEIYELWNDLKM